MKFLRLKNDKIVVLDNDTINPYSKDEIVKEANSLMQIADAYIRIGQTFKEVYCNGNDKYEENVEFDMHYNFTNVKLYFGIFVKSGIKYIATKVSKDEWEIFDV